MENLLFLTLKKKADVADHRQVFRHVGLLANRPPGTAGLPCI
jgi:F0F1-type ATP synthase alpha subunit